MSNARPYPWQELPKLRREDIAAVARATRALGDAGAAMREAATLFGVTPRVRLLGAGREAVGGDRTGALVADRIAIGLCAGSSKMAIDVDVSLALSALDRASGGTGGVVAPIVAVSQLELGMCSYLAGRLVRAGEHDWSIEAVFSSRGALAEWLGTSERGFVDASCAIGADRGRVRVWLPALTREPPTHRATRPGWLEIELALVVGTGSIDAAELATAHAGDVIVVDQRWATCDAMLRVRGHGRLQAPGAGAIRCALGPDGVVMESVEPTLDCAVRGEKESGMEPKAGDVVAGAQIEIAIEVLRVAMTVDEIGALRPGDVITSKQPTGAHVVLRAGQRAFAHGELVDVDGELGVRIVSLKA